MGACHEETYPMRAKYLSYGNRREPTEIGDVLGKVIEKASVNIDVRQGDLIERWTEVVPGDWAEVATPIGVRDRTLLVEVENGTAASLLKYQIERLIEAVSKVYGDDLVTAVKLRVSRS
jgi:predicted nucleic acid-binding Zn ribbon protein